MDKIASDLVFVFDEKIGYRVAKKLIGDIYYIAKDGNTSGNTQNLILLPPAESYLADSKRDLFNNGE